MQTLPIVGAKFRPPAEDVLRLLPANAPLLLRRQPENPHDGNAVQVLYKPDDSTSNDVLDVLVENAIEDIVHLGFIPREAAQQLAIVMDKWWCDNNPDEFDQNGGIVFDNLPEWPAALTFSATGRAMVSFTVPTTESQDEKSTER